jgi:hypothetical protein
MYLVLGPTRALALIAPPSWRDHIGMTVLLSNTGNMYERAWTKITTRSQFDDLVDDV